MFAYCNNNPVMFADPSGQAHQKVFGAFPDDIHDPWRDSLCGGGGAAGVLITVLLLAALAQQTSTTAISVPKAEILNRRKTKVAVKEEAEEKTITASPPSPNEQIYYHATTMENALAIKATNIMRGNRYEGGHIFAWRNMPSRNIIENSGAHFGVIISFKTNAAFESDPALNKPPFDFYGPVRSVFPGPIRVSDVVIIGR